MQCRANRSSGERGFTILEVIIVVGIILIVAAIAIPALLRSRIAANEAAAVQALRAIDTAQIGYLQVYPDMGTYACNLSYLGPPLGGGSANYTAADMIDDQLASGTKGGYTFFMNCTPPKSDGSTGYEVKAAPNGTSVSGSSCTSDNGRCFFTDQQGSVWVYLGTASSGPGNALAPLN